MVGLWTRNDFKDVPEEASPEWLIQALQNETHSGQIHGSDEELDRWIAAGRKARRDGLVPDGWRLEVRRRYFTVHFSLIEGAHPNSKVARESLGTIPVPERLARPHSVVRALRDAGLDRVSRGATPRALRILQAIAQEAERRGYSITAGDKSETMAVTIEGDSFGVTILELDDRSEHIPTAAELREQQRYSWTRIPQYDYSPSGRLSIELGGWSRGGHQYRWNDGKRSVIEDRLSEVFRELDARADEAKARRTEQERKHHERELQWRAAMETARRRYVEDVRAKELLRQVDAWSLTGRIRAYSDAIRSSSDPTEGSEADQWLEWIEAFAASLDPLRNPAAMPEVPEPAPEDLKPFLKGWSPYGP